MLKKVNQIEEILKIGNFNINYSNIIKKEDRH
jgi:hypothetical protein